MKADTITKGKVALIHSEPFFATVALGMQYQEDTTIKTGNIDGKTIRFNPEWIQGLSGEQVKGYLAAQVLHVASLHHTRRNGRDVKRWNLACDHAINGILKEAGFTLPDESTIDPQFNGMAAEQIYSLLPAPPPDQQPAPGQGPGSGDNDPGGNGGVSDAPGDTQAARDQVEAETKQLISQAALVAKQAGKLPGHLAELVTESLTPRVNWKEVLSAYLTEKARTDYSFKRPNPRYIGTGLYLPVLESVEKGRFVLLVDTSMSVNVPLLNEFAAEMQDILGEVAAGFTVIYVDTKVQGAPIEVEADDKLIFEPVGRGGTDFRPGFAAIEDEPAAIIYFTDGYCNSFPDDPGTPTLWAVYNNPNFLPPFGEVITIETV